MLAGFDRALAATHAGLHVISSGSCAGGAEAPLGPEAQALAALESRAHPLFHYDPEAGPIPTIKEGRGPGEPVPCKIYDEPETAGAAT